VVLENTTDKLLELNDALNNVIEQYKEVKGGNLVKMTVPSSSGDDESNNHKRSQDPSTPTQNSSLVDLLDFDGSSDGSPSSATTPTTTGMFLDYLLFTNIISNLRRCMVLGY